MYTTFYLREKNSFHIYALHNNRAKKNWIILTSGNNCFAWVHKVQIDGEGLAQEPQQSWSTAFKNDIVTIEDVTPPQIKKKRKKGEAGSPSLMLWKPFTFFSFIKYCSTKDQHSYLPLTG